MKKIEYENNKNMIHRSLRRIRREKGMTQNQLAAKLQVMNLNIDQQMISKIEKNRHIVTDYELVCICRILNVDLKDMLKDLYEHLDKERL